MNQTAKRILSLVLCLAMLIGVMPMFALGAKAAGTLIDAAIFCSDVHGSSSSVSSAFSGIKNADADFNPSTATFVGDTQMAASSVTSAAQSVYSDVACYYAYGNHDSEGDYGISDVTGLLYGDSTTNYYIYAISQTSMASSNPDTTGFTSTVAGLDKTKPLFIASHLPLHDRRGDSNGAAAWYEAISAAAESMDIVFFWAHNHTGENDVDRAAFYVAKDGDETFTLENTSTVVTPNFTYMNAGFVGKSSSRGGVVTTVKIYDDAMVFQDYTSSGAFTGEYSHNVEVVREFAGTTDSGDGDGGSTDTTDPTEGEDEETTTTKEVYVLVNALTNNGEYLIVNTNTAGEGYAMNHSSGTEGAAEVTIQTSGDYTYIDLDDSTAVWTATTKSSGFELMNGSYYLEAYGSTSAIEISTTQAYSGRYWVYDGTASTLGYFGGNGDHYVYYDSGFVSAKNSGSEAVYIYEKQTITVSSDGSGSGDSGDTGDGDDDTTGGSTDTTYGEGTYTTADDGSYQKVTFGTAGEKKTVYVLVSTPTAGKNYIIASGNSAGNVYALKENTTTGTSVEVNAASGSITAPYIENSDKAIVWTASSGMNFKSGNGGYYLNYSESRGSYSVSFSTSSASDWSAGTNTLYREGSKNDYYLRCNNGTWAMGSSNSTYNVYFYEEQTIDTSSEVTYSVTAEDVKHIFGNDSATAETATISASVTEGTPDGTYTYTVESGADIISVDADGNITFSGTEGTATVKVAYTFTQNNVEYTIWDTITVTASYPYYTVNLTHNSDGTGAEGTTSDYVSTPDTIAIKGVEAGDTYDLWAKVYLNGEGEAVTVDSSALTWSTNNSSVISQTADGNIVFTGNEGTAQVTVYYAYTDKNGETVYATDVVTFSVTKSSYYIPSDGTNDFPEYPNQGSIRIDKTGVALGNFSQTGIAQMELSMTGVPYGTSAKTDVVIMVDMTASMSDNDVTAAESAVKELIKSLVYDSENKKYDSNIQLFVDVFYSASDDSSFATEEYLNCVTISSDSELETATGKIDFTQSSKGGGTRYNLAMKDVYETLTRTGHADNQYAIFVSDGVATAYAPLTDGALGTTITGSNSETDSLCAGWFDDEGEVTSEFETEYYSYKIKTAGIPMYTVGANLTALSDAADLLNHMSSNYSPDGKTATGDTKYSFFCTTSEGITDEVLKIFQGIGADIKEAATNVVVEDKIADEYTMNFSLPSDVTASEAGMEEFYIQAVSYDLDENNERKDNPTVIEKFLFNSDGTITHTIGTTACGDSCTHVTYSDGKVSKIDGTYFDYTRTVNDDGTDSEIITWNAEKLDRHELALQYFLYLDNSAGVAAANQVAPGTYDTNAYAHITYTNHLDNECRQYFPVPSLTWKGAKVTYVFYLVNEDGQPVNRAGKVIPFAEAIYVTDPVSYDVTWNEIEGQENLLAESLMASAGVPDVYSLYDTDASYVIRVYETEGVDTTAKNGNYFEIAGADDKLIDSALDSDTTVDNSTTKVFNTKAGIKYDEYGVYSAHAAGTTLTTGTDDEGNATFTTTNFQAADIDYANTTVAFAVVWKPELTPDTVVIDYGLDVIIDVYENDGLAAGVSGVSLTAPSEVEINKGTYTNDKKVGSESITAANGVWSAKKESLTSVRFSLDKEKGMQFTEPAFFYYEAGVNYYTYDNTGSATLNTTNMYSSVTVIPATTIYYEDDFLTLSSYSKNDEGTFVADSTSKWTTDGTTLNETQDQDRPGESKISADLDADNNYGYDSAYETMSNHSMGSAKMITVDSATRGEATFTFYGTGFDVISTTSNTTGTLIVQLYSGASATGTAVKSLIVDTYYGYTQNDDGEWVISENNPNALYQVPVMKMSGLTYGQYTVKIIAGYNDKFNHTATEGSYVLHLDAIRIYDPTGNQNATANNAYVQDGEGWPQYMELRNNIIAASNYTVTENEDGTVTVTGENLPGAIFIDSADENTSITDYVSYGPNNELYLAAGQSVAFALDQSYANIIADVQIAMKLANGSSATYEICNAATDGTKSNVMTGTLTTATDLYYSINDLKSGKIVITNAEGGILSITNIKVTYTQNPNGTASASEEDGTNETMATSLYVDEEVATAAVMSLRRMPVVEEPEVEETQPTEPETEATEPETTEPETEATEPETEATEPETEATEPETEETEPDSGNSGSSGSGLIGLIRKLFGWLFG